MEAKTGLSFYIVIFQIFAQGVYSNNQQHNSRPHTKNGILDFLETIF